MYRSLIRSSVLVTLLTLFVSCGPDAGATVDGARKLLAAGDTSGAVQLLQEYREKSPSDSEFDDALAGLLGYLDDRSVELFNGGDEAGAAALLEGTRVLFGAEPQWIISLARVYEAQGDVPKAVRLLREGMELPGEHSEILSMLVETYWGLNQSDLAAKTLLQARSSGWSDKSTALMLGVTLGRQGKFEAAREELERARKSGADKASLDYNLALLLRREGRLDEAREKFASASREEGSLALIAKRELLRLEIDAGNIDAEDAQAVLDECWAMSDERPTDWRIFELIGDLFMMQGDYHAAKGAFENALRHGRNPTQIEDKFVAATLAIQDSEGANEADPGK